MLKIFIQLVCCGLQHALHTIYWLHTIHANVPQQKATCIDTSTEKCCTVGLPWLMGIIHRSQATLHRLADIASSTHTAYLVCNEQGMHATTTALQVKTCFRLALAGCCFLSYVQQQLQMLSGELPDQALLYNFIIGRCASLTVGSVHDSRGSRLADYTRPFGRDSRQHVRQQGS